MILIADSGSTKCDWLMTDDKGNKLGTYKTMGLNPYFHSEKIFSNAVLGNKELEAVASEVTYVFFYGAGASTETLCKIAERGLQVAFQAAKIFVDHDLVGAAYSTYQGEPAITCILGTGSNSCYFDGKVVSEEVPSLAYILGDEGSGSYFGKILLRAYFYKKLPEDLLEAFESRYELTKDILVDKVYHQPNANVYLASFMRFLGEHSTHPLVKEWVKEGVNKFVDIHVKCFSNWKEVPVHFVGSIGYYFTDVIKEVAAENGFKLGQLIKKPIDALVNYHIRYKLPQLQKLS
jgi:glucosamine kinase